MYLVVNTNFKMKTITLLFSVFLFALVFASDDLEDAVCSEEGQLLPHQDCSKYYICNNGAQVVQECPTGTIFNPAAGGCDFPANVPECVGGTRPPVDQTDATTVRPPTNGTTTTVAPPTNGTTTTVAPPTNGTTTTVAPPTNGTTTTVLPPINGTTTTVLPPINGTTTTVLPPINGTTTTVLPPINGTTTTVLPPINGTTTTVLPPINGTTTTVLPPINGTTTTVLPPINGTTTTVLPPINGTTTTVLPPINGTTTTVLPPINGTTTTSRPPINGTTTTELPVEESTEDSRVCKEDGIYTLPVPGNCSLYILCVHGQAVSQTCPPGTFFDPEVGTCNIADLVESCSAPLCEVGEVILKPVPGNCTQFIICADGESAVGTCPPGTLFDPEFHQCNLASEVNCDDGDDGSNASTPSSQMKPKELSSSEKTGFKNIFQRVFG